MTQYQTLTLDVDEHIATLTLSRPDNMNAFTVQMADELEDFFTQVNNNDDIRAVIVTGSGKTFCAGMDLSSEGNVFGLDGDTQPTLDDMHNRLDEQAMIDGVRDTGGRVTLAIYNCKKPVIAAINGAAVGIGATMTLAMDFRLASEKARIGFVFGRLGIVPEACSSWFLPRLVGIQQALEWCYSADILKAEEALAGGLVKSISTPEALLDDAKALAKKFTGNRSPVAVALTRQMLYRNSAQPHPIEAHRIDSLAMFYTSIGDGEEGVQAFLEKREAQFEAKASTDMPPFYKDWAK